MNNTLLKKIKSEFINLFDKKPIVAYAPGRINLIGGHTDYNGGYVFPAAIDKGIFAAVSKSQGEVCRVKALDVNEDFQFMLSEISPIPQRGWQNYLLGVIAQLQKKGLTIKAFDLVFGGDIPIGSGLSSSASLENSILLALNQLFKLELSKKEMIQMAQKAEHEFAGVACGILDQYASMFGRKGQAFLLNCKSMEVLYTKADFRLYELILINSNVHHELSSSAYNERRKTCEAVAKKTGVNVVSELNQAMLFENKLELTNDEFQKAQYIIKENERVLLAYKALKTGDIPTFGSMMYATHDGLKNEYQISCPEIDFLVDLARKYNVIGSRILGGGFGGCTLNLIKKGDTEQIEKICKEYKDKFKITPSIIPLKLGEGAKILEDE